ncbi:MAG: hypothetical protein ACQEP3_01345 [Patescibacteria group bacterium]
MEEETNKNKIEKERKKTEKELKEDGAKQISNRDEKGRFAEGYRLEVTPEQIEKAKKEMEESFKTLESKMEENKRKIEELEKEYIEKGYPDEIEERILKLEEKIKDEEKRGRLKEISDKRKKLMSDLEDLEKEVDPKGIKTRSDEEIEEEFVEKEKEIKEMEKEKEKLLNELEEQFEEKPKSKNSKKGKLKTAREIALEDLENIDKKLEEEDNNKEEENGKEKEGGKEEKKTDKNVEEEIDKVAKKIVDNEMLNNDEMKIQQENREEVRKRVSELYKEEAESKKEEKSEKKETNDQEEEKDSDEEKEEKIVNEEGLPEDLVEHLNKHTFEETNKSILQKGWKKSRNLMGAIGGALGLKKLATTVPGVSQFIKTAGTAGAMTGGAIAGVGLKLGSYGLEKWDETKKHKNFKENINEEIESSERSSKEVIENRMADLNTNMGIVKERLNELQREKEEMKEEGVWFFQKERREISAEITQHRKALERAEDQFRYLSVELKEREEGVNVEELAEKLIKDKKEQLKEKMEAGGPHSNLLKIMLISLEGSENIPGNETKEKANLMKTVKKAETGLMAKLEQENRSMAKEILFSAGLVAAFAGVADYVMELEPVQEKMENISDWISNKIDSLKGEPSSSEISEFERMLEKLKITTEENALETVDQIAEKEVSYSIEASDNIWSVTEEFLNDSLGEEFASLSEAEQTYVIDHITTTIESNPQSFGIDFAEGETIDHLFASSEHSVDFSPLLDGELEIALQKAESLSTEEVANILENNEAIREFLSEHKNVKITGETIESITGGAEIGELTEEKIADELILDGLKSESISSTEQLQNIESWLEDMHNGELSEASFDFMADTSEGGQRELWVKQLAKVEGVSYEEMETMIEDSFADIEGGAVESTAAEVANEGLTEREKEIVADWVEKIENDSLGESQYETLLDSKHEEMLEEIAKERGSSVEETEELIRERIQEIQEESGEVKTSPLGESREEAEELAEQVAGETEAAETETTSEKTTEVNEGSVETTYEIEGTITRNDRWDFFEAFQQEFGEEIFVESDIAELLESGEITPEEFMNWVEDGAFEEPVDFGGEHPPKDVLTRQLENSIERMKEAEDQTVYMGRLRALKMQISRLILYGK